MDTGQGYDYEVALAIRPSFHFIPFVHLFMHSCIKIAIFCLGARLLCNLLSRQGLNPISLAS